MAGLISILLGGTIAVLIVILAGACLIIKFFKK